MAHFIGHLYGNRGPASRLGTKSSGVRVDARGWGIGANASIHYNEREDRDEVSVSIDGGSGYGGETRYLGTFIRRGNKFIRISKR